MENKAFRDMTNEIVNVGDTGLILIKTYGYKKLSNADLCFAKYIGYENRLYNFLVKVDKYSAKTIKKRNISFVKKELDFDSITAGGNGNE